MFVVVVFETSIKIDGHGILAGGVERRVRVHIGSFEIILLRISMMFGTALIDRHSHRTFLAYSLVCMDLQHPCLFHGLREVFCSFSHT